MADLEEIPEFEFSQSTIVYVIGAASSKKGTVFM